MSLSALVAGVALGGLRCGVIKYQLLERESFVLYSANQVKESFRGDGHLKTHSQVRYESMPSREHEYYTYVREGWNSKVLTFRNRMYEFFETKRVADLSTEFRAGSILTCWCLSIVDWSKELQESSYLNLQPSLLRKRTFELLAIS